MLLIVIVVFEVFQQFVNGVCVELMRNGSEAVVLEDVVDGGSVSVKFATSFVNVFESGDDVL